MLSFAATKVIYLVHKTIMYSIMFHKLLQDTLAVYDGIRLIQDIMKVINAKNEFKLGRGIVIPGQNVDVQW